MTCSLLLPLLVADVSACLDVVLVPSVTGKHTCGVTENRETQAAVMAQARQRRDAQVAELRSAWAAAGGRGSRGAGAELCAIRCVLSPALPAWQFCEDPGALARRALHGQPAVHGGEPVCQAA
jgi:hypothetical protein